MKKIITLIAAVMLTATAHAQFNVQRTTVTSNKAGDNWYIGINGGVATPMIKFDNPATGASDWGGCMKGFAPTAGLRIGKNLTTVFGLAADAKVIFEADEKSGIKQKTFIDAARVNLMGTFNLSNLFAGYNGEPRFFEVIALAGPGWTHAFGSEWKENALVGTAAIDLAFNLGAEKQWQLYLEPAVNYMLLGWEGSSCIKNDFKFDQRCGIWQLSLGVNYKFKNSNGDHNFKVEKLRDQAEIDALNAQINNLRTDFGAQLSDAEAKLAEAEQTISNLKAELAACQARPVQTVVHETKTENILQPMVIFRQGKSTIEPAQYASIEMVAKYMRNHKDAKVIVRGFASPEGNAELNQKLSEARAASVKTALVNRYKIASERITVEGMGATDKISEENDFNRVAMFIDTTK